MSNMLAFADVSGPVSILGNPFADQLIFISAMAFLDERVTFELSKLIEGLGMPGLATPNPADGTKTPTATRLLRSFADTKLDVSVTALKKLTS